MDGIWYLIIFVFIFLLLCAFSKTRDIIVLHLSEVLSTIGGIALGLVGIRATSQEKFIGIYSWQDAWGLLFIISSALLIIGLFLNAKNSRSLSNAKKLSSENKNLQKKLLSVEEEYYRLCSDNIKWIFKDFFSSGNDRISIYKHQGDHFTLLGRYSQNPQFNKRSNYSYPDNEGMIAIAWNKGECDKQNAPLYTGKGEAWKNYMKAHCNISDIRLNNITMKSRSLFIKTLNDDNTSENPDGIIVFEKLTINSIDINSLKAKLESSNPQILSLLKNMKSLTKKLEVSKEI